MSFDYLNNAFRRLSQLNEETFDISFEGRSNLADFMDQDIEDQTVVDVIDSDVESETELQTSYLGKVITNCNVCHSHIFENKEDIEIDDDNTVNPEKQCPYCGETLGFTIVGEVVPFTSETSSEEEDTEPKITVNDDEVVADETVTTETENSTEEADASEEESKDETEEKNTDMNESVALLDPPVTRDLTQIKGTIADVLVAHSADIDACGINETAVKDCITQILRSDEIKSSEAAEEAIRIINKCKGPKLWSTIGTYMSGLKVGSTKKLFASLEEEVNNVNVETDDSIITVNTEEDGKVTVSTEKKEPEQTGEEAVGPLSDETIDTIATQNNLEPSEEETVENTEAESTDETAEETSAEEIAEEPANDTTSEETEDDENVDVDIEEVDEESVNELGESYFTSVYDNVKSFRTTDISCSDSHMVVEGVITFTSGKSKKTGFIFEAATATKDGSVLFKGSNKHVSESANAFTLSGKVTNKHLVTESLNYNYTPVGQSERIHGNIARD